ncbi:ATP-grasp domain-containing protein [Jeotgalibacillus sp. R-1-5s-1]|uniref:ATP-grasp domain-containing protein n=1 Tax=Jeotgalibacillus sp. R-1-5s-1 TaxID=2555897 RepID=UPI00106BEA99|nr:ATP-grasp domain-containing protein [Jeotgalibacillus sp. R-1-5s-1]TFD95798.1 ATP-grasp domain-containing protein [Jeotgalibacillus sp. R-1-5s-1]
MLKNRNLKLFVTGIGGDIGFGILKCLNEIKYHSMLVGCDINDYPIGKLEVDKFHIAPKASEKDHYINFMLEICLKYDIDIIIPSSEQEIKVLNENKELFNTYNIKILINNNFIVRNFTDKHKTIEFFKKNHIKHPKTYILKEFKGELKFPIILKLKESVGGKGIFKIDDEIDLDYFKKKHQDAIVQEIIGTIDNEYTIGIFSDGKSTYNIAFQRYLGFGSLSRQVKLVQDEKIDQLSKKIAKITNLRGSINVQVRKDFTGEYIPFEINPRLSSTIYFRHYFGFEDLKWWLDIYLGNKICYTPKFKKGVGVRTLNEVFFDLEK